MGPWAHLMPTCPSQQAMTPKGTVRLSDTAPKEEANSLSQDDGKVRSPRLEAGSPIPSGEEVAKEEAAGIPGWTVGKPGSSAGTSRGCGSFWEPQNTAGQGGWGASR